MNPLTITSILSIACILSAYSQSVENSQAQPSSSTATCSLKATPKQDPQLVTGKLANGLTYMIRPNAEPKGRFSIRLRVNTGSLNETDDIQGISHFIEHMVFNGSNHFKRGEIITAMQKEGLGLGGDANAYTAFDETVYMIDVPSLKDSTVKLAFTIMRDFADGAHLEEDAINAERGIITSEYKARDSAMFRVSKEMISILLDGTLIPHRFPIGTLDMIQNCPRQKFLDYYQKHYVPSQMQLIIVGDVSVEQAEKWVKEYFSSMKKDNYSFSLDKGQVKPAEKISAHWITNKEATSTDISLAIVKPFKKEPDTVAKRVKDLPLSMAYSMLNRRLEKISKLPICPFISAGGDKSTLFQMAEMNTFQVKTDYTKWKSALACVEQELRRAIEHGFNEAELDEPRRNAIAMSENAIKSWATAKSDGLADALVGCAASGDVFTTPEEDWRIIKPALMSLTTKQCQEALKKVWSEAVPRIIITSNTELADGEKEALNVYHLAKTAKVEPYKVQTFKPFDYTFGEPGKVVAKTEVPDLGVTQLTLSNGVRVNLKPTEFDKDSISILYSIDGGSVTRPVNAAGLDSFADAIMQAGGLKNHSADELESILSGKRVGVGFGIDIDCFKIQGSTNRKDLETQLQLQTAAMMYPGFREDGAILFRRAMPMLFNKLRHDVSGPMQMKVPALIYKNNPRYLFPTQEQLASYKVEDVKNWLEVPLKKNYLEVTVTGDFDVATIIPLLERTVGAVPARAPKPAVVPDEIKNPEMITFNSKHDLLYESTIDKTMVCSYWKLPAVTDKKSMRRMNMLRAILKDRMFKGIRENMGETYSPSTRISVSEIFKNSGYIASMSSGVMRNKELVYKAMADIASKLANGEEPLTQDELDRSRNPLLNGMERSYRSNAYWQGLLSDSQQKPERMQEHREAVEDFKSITLEEMKALAKEVFGKGEILNINILPDNPKEEVAPAATPASFSYSVNVTASTVAKKKFDVQELSSPYAVLISADTAKLPAWKNVASTLARKHKAKVFTYEGSVYSKLDVLKKYAPRYIALVGQPEELDRTTVNDMHRMTRQLDEDIYGDCIWGMVTGYTPKDAMRIAKATKPLIITRGMGTTNIDTSRFSRSMCLTDWQAFQYVEQTGNKSGVQPQFYTEGVKAQEAKNPDSYGIAPKLKGYWETAKPQLFVTSSHATQYNLEMPFGKGIIVSGDNKFHMLTQKQFSEFGSFLSGALFGGKEDDLTAFLKRNNPPVIKPNPGPAVWLASGNCLLGDAKKSKNSMAVTALSAYGFNQLVGYTVPSWYGKGGWGTLSLFFGNHDASSLAESWYLNNQFILDETVQRFPNLMKVSFNAADVNGALRDPNFVNGLRNAGYGGGKDQIGLVHDRDCVAFYGDPAWVARLDESHSKSPWHITWNNPADASKGFTITANQDAKSRVGIWFPNRIKATTALASKDGVSMPMDKAALLTNDFLLIRELQLKKGETISIELK